jgi:hypothetical protein
MAHACSNEEILGCKNISPLCLAGAPGTAEWGQKATQLRDHGGVSGAAVLAHVRIARGGRQTTGKDDESHSLWSRVFR